jgi:hypothetical protein
LELKKRKKESECLAAKKAKATRGSKESELDAKVLAELDQNGKQYETEEGSASMTCPQLDALLRAVLGKTVKGNRPAKLARWLEVRRDQDRAYFLGPRAGEEEDGGRCNANAGVARDRQGLVQDVA